LQKVLSGTGLTGSQVSALKTAAEGTERAEPNERKHARNIVGRAVRDGRLLKPKQCSQCCSSDRIHAHHADYSSPLDVEWLCHKCHERRHSEERTHCAHGHELTGHNIYWHGELRKCRVCLGERAPRRYATDTTVRERQKQLARDRAKRRPRRSHHAKEAIA